MSAAQHQAQPFRKYPLWMRHPNEQAAVICDEREVIDGRERWVHKPPGQARKFPPCLAIDEDQEAYFSAQGYVPIAGNPDAYLRATVAVTPPGYVHHEFPRMLDDGTIDLGPDAPAPPDNFYPYYVRMEGYEPTLVQDLDEHQALLQKRGTELPPSPDTADQEIAELERKLAEARARKAEQPEPMTRTQQEFVEAVVKKQEDFYYGPASPVTAPDIVESEKAITLPILRMQAEQLGIKADRRWGVARLRKAIAEAEKTE